MEKAYLPNTKTRIRLHIRTYLISNFIGVQLLWLITCFMAEPLNFKNIIPALNKAVCIGFMSWSLSLPCMLLPFLISVACFRYFRLPALAWYAVFGGLQELLPSFLSQLSQTPLPSYLCTER